MTTLFDFNQHTYALCYYFFLQQKRYLLSCRLMRVSPSPMFMCFSSFFVVFICIFYEFFFLRFLLIFMNSTIIMNFNFYFLLYVLIYNTFLNMVCNHRCANILKTLLSLVCKKCYAWKWFPCGKLQIHYEMQFFIIVTVFRVICLIDIFHPKNFTEWITKKLPDVNSITRCWRHAQLSTNKTLKTNFILCSPKEICEKYTDTMKKQRRNMCNTTLRAFQVKWTTQYRMYIKMDSQNCET